MQANRHVSKANKKQDDIRSDHVGNVMGDKSVLLKTNKILILVFLTCFCGISLMMEDIFKESLT